MHLSPFQLFSLNNLPAMGVGGGEASFPPLSSFRCPDPRLLLGTRPTPPPSRPPGLWTTVHLPDCPTGTAEQRDQDDAHDGGHGPGTPEGTHTYWYAWWLCPPPPPAESEGLSEAPLPHFLGRAVPRRPWPRDEAPSQPRVSLLASGPGAQRRHLCCCPRPGRNPRERAGAQRKSCPRPALGARGARGPGMKATRKRAGEFRGETRVGTQAGGRVTRTSWRAAPRASLARLARALPSARSSLARRWRSPRGGRDRASCAGPGRPARGLRPPRPGSASSAALHPRARRVTPPFLSSG